MTTTENRVYDPDDTSSTQDLEREEMEREWEEYARKFPCVGCGFCCRKASCFSARDLDLVEAGQCTALRWDGKKYRCAIMEEVSLRGLQFRLQLGAGKGCGSALNTDRQKIPRPSECGWDHLER